MKGEKARLMANMFKSLATNISKCSNNADSLPNGSETRSRGVRQVEGTIDGESHESMSGFCVITLDYTILALYVSWDQVGRDLEGRALVNI